jgi:RNA polymerase-binding transcription factor DksA
MATKKPAPKKAIKPAPKKATKKPAPKKVIAKKPAAKPVAKKPVPKKPARPLGGAVAKPVAKAKVVAKPAVKAKPVAKPVAKAIVKPVAKPVAKPAPLPAKPAARPEPPPVPPPPVKKGGFDPKSLVTIKPKAAAIIKKEPPKPSKVVIPKTTAKSSVKYEPEFTKSVLDASAINYANNGPTMKYSDADLTEFREIIQRKLDAAKKELSYLQGLITRKDEGGDMDEGRYMTMEDGSVSMEREQLSQMASRQITFIDHLEKAMMRIENKTYGVCRVTGKLIDKARLKAVPHATLSIEAKQMMTK